MMSPFMFRLKVQPVQESCLFELSWGKGQQLFATLNYPELVTKLYQEWQHTYLTFYQSALRGRKGGSGSGTLQVDWRTKLVEVETHFLSEFHRWLRSEALFEIREEIAHTTQKCSELPHREKSPCSVDIFLTCGSIELERLPWEAWEISTKLVTNGVVRFTRTPVNIRNEPVAKKGSGKIRILAIIGDEEGLNFKTEKQALRSLSHLAEVEFVGWQPGEDVEQLKTQICQKIADPNGWDMLFFAGHSNETPHTGGELAIAPGASICIHEIKEPLTKAKEKGLQFAIFNSCNGLSIANSLINLGLNQVVVMREPIHNQVAQVFFSQFLEELAQYKDVSTALLAVCQHLKRSDNIRYPSAYLLPSLYGHPDAVSFRIKPHSLWHQLQPWLPSNRLEAGTLTLALLLSLLSPIQNYLLDGRIWMQAVFRDVTGQIPDIKPSVLLIQIDSKSIRNAGISNPHPMPRDYLARIVNRLAFFKAKVIGVDYVFDRLQPGKDQILSQSVAKAIQTNNTLFVLAKIKDEFEGEVGVNPETGIMSKNHSVLQASIHAFPNYVELLPAQGDCTSDCPFAYLLTIAYALNLELPHPQLPAQVSSSAQLVNYLTKVVNYLKQKNKQNKLLSFLQNSHFHPITSFSENFNQIWLQPINDFSVSPPKVYERVFAWQLLDDSFKAPVLDQVAQKIVIVAPGGYDEAGVIQGSDNFPVPMAMSYWRTRQRSATNQPEVYPKVFTGSEAHAYAIHHLLTQQLVIPIPDSWMIVVAFLLGKLTILSLPQQPRQRWQRTVGLLGTTAVYGLAGLQVYISMAVLIPWFLPSAVFWIYVIPTIKR